MQEQITIGTCSLLKVKSYLARLLATSTIMCILAQLEDRSRDPDIMNDIGYLLTIWVSSQFMPPSLLVGVVYDDTLILDIHCVDESQNTASAKGIDIDGMWRARLRSCQDSNISEFVSLHICCGDSGIIWTTSVYLHSAVLRHHNLSATLIIYSLFADILCTMLGTICIPTGRDDISTTRTESSPSPSWQYNL